MTLMKTLNGYEVCDQVLREQLDNKSNIDHTHTAVDIGAVPDEDSGWINIYVTEKLFVVAKKKNGMVYVIGRSEGGYNISKDANSNNYAKVTTLPSYMRPSFPIEFAFHCYGGESWRQRGYIGTNGIINMYEESTGKNWWGFSVSFPV